MKKFLSITLCLCLIMTLIAGCSENKISTSQTVSGLTTITSLPADSSQFSAVPQITSKSAAVLSTVVSGEYTGDATLVPNGSIKELVLPKSISEKITFTAVTANMKSIEFDANSDADQMLSVTDPNGLVWTLTIPANALEEATTISMTPLTSIQSEALNKLESGVSLEPDGLTFLKPATLSVSSGHPLGTPVFLAGNHAGTALELTILDPEQKGLQVTIRHFSNTYWDSLTEEEKKKKLKEWAEQEYENAIKEAQELLKKSIEVAAPPVIPIQCAEDKKTQSDILAKYISQFGLNETILLSKILAAATSMQLQGVYKEGWREICEKLVARLDKKCSRLIKTYYPQQDYYIAVSKVILETVRQGQLNGTYLNNHLPELSLWAKSVAAKLVKDLREKHDYTAIQVAANLILDAETWGADLGNLVTEMMQASNFEIQYEGEAGQFAQGLSYSVRGTAASCTTSKPGKIAYATGNGKYTDFKFPIPNDKVDIKLQMQTYAFETSIESLNICNQASVNILIDRFGLDQDYLIVTAKGQTAMQPTASGVHQVFMSAMTDRAVLRPAKKKYFYLFQLPVQNFNALAAEKTFTAKSGMDLKITIRLIHKPL